MEKHKIKIIKNSQGIPLKIFFDDKEVIGVDEIKIKYSYECKTKMSKKKVVISLMDFEILEIINQ